jgi:hypothetical protein
MTFKSLDDIEREKRERDRVKFKEDVSKDIVDVFGNIRDKMGIKPPPKKKPFFKTAIKNILFWLFILFLLILVVNLILGNIWLLKFFIKSLFLK